MPMILYRSTRQWCSRTLACLLLGLLSFTDGPAAQDSAGRQTADRAAPGWVAPPEPLPTDLRRTTLIVRDLDRSLALYEGVVGLRVNYDIPTTMAGEQIPAGTSGDEARFALLSSNDPWVGMLGLLQWTRPPLPDPGPYPRRMAPGGIVLVFNSDDVERRCAAAAELPAVTLVSPAKVQIFPGRNGSGELRVLGCTLFDPDGNLLELNELLGR